ncbi:hypothetical protein NE578_10440, partial [Schaalia odontolytica]|uniref:hypothetical protein n=1 Tax=Schaalia odontolytica TaxID=1660 RepID=UPI00210B7DFC
EKFGLLSVGKLTGSSECGEIVEDLHWIAAVSSESPETSSFGHSSARLFKKMGTGLVPIQFPLSNAFL